MSGATDILNMLEVYSGRFPSILLIYQQGLSCLPIRLSEDAAFKRGANLQIASQPIDLTNTL